MVILGGFARRGSRIRCLDERLDLERSSCKPKPQQALVWRREGLVLPEAHHPCLCDCARQRMCGAVTVVGKRSVVTAARCPLLSSSNRCFSTSAPVSWSPDVTLHSTLATIMLIRLLLVSFSMDPVSPCPIPVLSVSNPALRSSFVRAL